MNSQTAWTESVIRNHLQTFLDEKGPDAIVSAFIAGLPEGAIGRFTPSEPIPSSSRMGTSSRRRSR